jgi:proteasome assembly chaperone (PAC2) family protein
MTIELVRPWLVAAWPGMGGVAQIAVTYLVQKLGARPMVELDPASFFEVSSIRVQGGLVQPSELPRSVFYGWKNPGTGQDLLILLGDRQPSGDIPRYGDALLEIAAQHAVERVITFAAMGTPIHPQAQPRVFGIATTAALLDELKRSDVVLLEEGEISGLNGVFLAAAAARGLAGLGLLGEFPFFASPVPNPKASAAVLRVFGALAGVEIDLADLLSDAERIERGLVQHLERLQQAAQLAAHGAEGETPEEPTFPRPEETPREREIPPEVERKIEKLFEQAKRDRSKALALKAELDRHRLFKHYEDRFLDLFKQAG